MAEDKTFYKAQPTAAETQINWAEVGKLFSDRLSAEATAREEEKASYDKMSRDYVETLNSVEQGQSATANQWWLNAAAEMQQQMLMQDRMLKSGAIKPKDFTLMRQNLNDGTDGLIGVFNKFNTEYKERMDRFEDGDSQKLEQWVMAEMENFGNFQQTAVVVNPESGSLSVANLDDKGNIIDNPNAIRSVNSLQGLLARRYDSYNLEDATSKYAETIGVFDTINRTIGTGTRKGIIEKVSSPMFKGLSPEELMKLAESNKEPITLEQAEAMSAELDIYVAGENQFTTSIMSNWTNVSSILTENVVFARNGEAFDFTFDPNRKENQILLKKDAQGQVFAEYTPEQEEAVKKAIKDSLRNKLDRKVTTNVVADYTTRPNQQEINRGRTIAKQKDILTNVYQLYSGDTGEAQEAARFLAGNNPSIREIERTNDGVKITFTNGRVEPLTFGTMDEAAWATSSLAFFIPEGNVEIDIEEQRKVALGDSDGKLATAKVLPEAVTYESEIDDTSPDNIEAIVINDVSKKLNSDLFFNQSVNDVKGKIANIVAPLGFEVDIDLDERFGPFNDFRIINNSTNPPIEAEFNTNFSSIDQAEAEMAKVLTWINSQLSKENSEGYLRMVKPTKEENTGTVTPNLAP